MLAQVLVVFRFFDIQNYTHENMLGEEITTMNLGEAPKRMHDPKSYLTRLFAQEMAKFNYAHEDLPNDSMYRVAVNFL